MSSRQKPSSRPRLRHQSIPLVFSLTASRAICSSMEHCPRLPKRSLWLSTLTALVVAQVLLPLFGPAGVRAESEESLKWTIRVLTVDSNEGIDLADFNRDGKLDVVAGRNWYAAPEFTPRPLRLIDDWSGYVLSNGDFAYDVNRDGWTDVIAGAFNLPEVCWYENPGAQDLSMGKLWPKHLLADTGATTNEGQLLYDIDGDGAPEWVVNSWTPDTPFVAWKLAQRAAGGNGNQQEFLLERAVIGRDLNGHGMGFGDLNGDGRADLLFESGWYEAPATGSLSEPWALHRDWNVHASIPILVRDLNGDGRNDVIIGHGHDYGLYWWEQRQPRSDGTLTWSEHVIDDSFSQVHAIHFADLDGDGQDELIAGKRVLAHNGQDPGSSDPPFIAYYVWNAGSNSFQKHVIDEGRVGGGLQIRTGDLNGDGRLDIAVAGKSGTYILFNEGK